MCTHIWGFQCGTGVKNLSANEEDTKTEGSTPE